MVGLLVMGAWAQDPGSKKATIQHLREAETAPGTYYSLRPILDVLDKAKLSGSLEFSGSCNTPGFAEFPQLRAPVTSGGSPLQTLREIFADDPAMRVTQHADGTIRMIEKNVPTDILNVRIGHILFGSDGSGVYSANSALELILSSPEINLYMKAHDINLPHENFRFISFESNAITIRDLPHIEGTTVTAPPEMPAVGTNPDWVTHIEGSLDNVTFSETMDHIVKTFPGIWLYENCPRSDTRKRIVLFRFLHLEDTILGVIVN